MPESGLHERGYLFAEQGLAIPLRNDAPPAEGWIYDDGPLDELSVEAHWSARYSQCVEICDRLLSKGKLPVEQRDRFERNKNIAVGKLAGAASSEAARDESPAFSHTQSARSAICGESRRPRPPSTYMEQSGRRDSAMVMADWRRLGFSPSDDQPIPYIERTRTYYAALGYAPYRWASFAGTPFAEPRKPLSQSCVALVTTAAPFDPARGEQGPGAAYNAAAKFHSAYSLPCDSAPDLRISHIAYDRRHTSAEDQRSYNPLLTLRAAAEAGRVGRVAARLHGAPTNRSQRVTIETDAPDILRRCREDGADIAILVPNCPVCHQTTCLIARHLEANGVVTVIMGCAKDIVEHCGAPRFCFSDFPLGNGAGKPNDPRSQADTLDLALRLVEADLGPRTTVQSPQRWSQDPSWRFDYCNVERISPVELESLKREFARQKAIANQALESERRAIDTPDRKAP